MEPSQAVVLGGCAPRPNGYADFKADVPYTLASGDRLRVIVFGQDGLSNTYGVNSAGSISMPLIGSVRAQGLTTVALEWPASAWAPSPWSTADCWTAARP